MALTAQSGNIFSPYHKYPFIIGNVRIPLFFKFTQNPNNIKIAMKKEFQQTKTIGGYVFEHWGRQPVTMTGTVIIKKSHSLENFLGLNTDSANLGVEDPMYSPELMTFQTLFDIDQRRIKQLFSKEADKYISNSVMGTTIAASILKNPITLVSSGVGMALEPKVDGNDVRFREPEPTTITGYLDTLTDTIILYKGVIYSGFFTDFSWEEDGKDPFVNKVNFSFLVTYSTTDWINTTLTQTAVGRGISALWGATTSTVTIGSMLEDVLKGTGSDTYGHI